MTSSRATGVCRWQRFSLRSMLTMTVVLAAVLGSWRLHFEPHSKAIIAVSNLGGVASTDELLSGWEYLPDWVLDYELKYPFLSSCYDFVGQFVVVGETLEEVYFHGAWSPPDTNHYWYTLSSDIGDAELELLVGALERLSKTPELVLVGTSITDQGVKHIGRLHRLERLNLMGTKVTDEGLRHLGVLQLQRPNSHRSGEGQHPLAAGQVTDKSPNREYLVD